MAVTNAESMLKPHVAFLPSPGMGHIIPLLEFAKRLVQDHGIRATFFLISTDASAAQNDLCRSTSLPAGLNIVEIPPIDMSGILNDDMKILTRISANVGESIKLLPNIIKQLPDLPKALIIDLFCTQAFDVCKELSIPIFSFWTASSSLLALSLYLPTLDREVAGEFVDLPAPIQAPGCNPIRPKDLIDQLKNRKIEEYKWYYYHVSRLPLAAGIFINSWEDLEPVTLRALKENSFFQSIPIPRVITIGPLIKQDEAVNGNGTDILSWLDDQPPESVLFVAFGSGGSLSTKQLTELAWGLEMSQQRFILVARKPSDASASASFFRAGGGDGDDPLLYLPEGFVRRTTDRGYVVPNWAPQAAVLSHSSAGAFLSHCGWNSTLESIVHGVPMISWPLYAEQRMNAAMLSEEVGVAVRPMAADGEEVIGRAEIERVIRLTIKGDKGIAMKHRVKELKNSALMTLQEGGPSYNNLRGFAQTLFSK